MSDDLKGLSDLAYSGEELLEGLLGARGDAEIDTLMERVQRWSGELIAAGEAHDRIRLRFRMIRPTAEETARIWPLYPELRDDQRGHCNYVEAALGRLNAYLRQSDARPKRPGRRRGVKLYYDRAAIAEARKRLAQPNPPSRHKVAWEVEPLADRGASPEANAARVYKALRDV